MKFTKGKMFEPPKISFKTIKQNKTLSDFQAKREASQN